VLVAGFSSYYSFLLFFFSFFFGVVMLFIITNMSFYSSSFSGKHSVGPNDIFTTLSNIRTTLAEKLQCRAHGQDGVAIRVSGSFIIGNQFLICGDGIQVEGLPNFKDLSIDLSSKRMGTFREQFIMEPSNLIGCYLIAKQELYIIQ